MAKKMTPVQWVALIISIFLCFFTSKITPFEGLTEAGMQVLGILVGAIILWLTNGASWTNLLVLMAMATIPGQSMKTVVSGSFGNDTAVFLLFCFMLAVSLTKTGLARRVAIWFVTNKLGRKSAWYTIFMYFAALFIMSLFLSSTSTFMIFLPIMTEILESIGYRKEDKPAVGAMMVLGTVLVGQISNSCTPISHAMSITGMTNFTSYTEKTIDLFTFCAALIPVAIVCTIVFFIYAKFVWKPDVSNFSKIDYDALEASTGVMTKKEKIAAIVYIIVVILWVLPGVCKYVAPEAYATLSKIQQCYPPVFAVLLLNLIRVDGEKVVPFEDSFKGANWGSFVFIATIMELGSLVSNGDIGLKTWLADVCTPIAAGLNPTMFLIIISAFGIILTNFVSNAVGLAVCYAVGMPLCLSLYEGQINPMVLGLLITASVQYAWAAPSSTPNAAVAAGSGWIETGNMLKHGLIIAVIMCVFFCLVGIPFTTLICG